MGIDRFNGPLRGRGLTASPEISTGEWGRVFVRLCLWGEIAEIWVDAETGSKKELVEGGGGVRTRRTDENIEEVKEMD